MTGHSLPPKHLKNSFNSEASSTGVETLFFADDMKVIAKKEEITERRRIIETVIKPIK